MRNRIAGAVAALVMALAAAVVGVQSPAGAEVLTPSNCNGPCLTVKAGPAPVECWVPCESLPAAEPEPAPKVGERSAASVASGLADPPADCPPRYFYDAFCVYDSVNYVNLIDWWYPDEPRNSCVFIEQGPQYLADSLYNNTNFDWRYFRTTRCDGSHLTIKAYTSIPRLPDGWRNKVVAFSRTSTCGVCR